MKYLRYKHRHSRKNSGKTQPRTIYYLLLWIYYSWFEEASSWNINFTAIFCTFLFANENSSPDSIVTPLTSLCIPFNVLNILWFKELCLCSSNVLRASEAEKDSERIKFNETERKGPKFNERNLHSVRDKLWKEILLFLPPSVSTPPTQYLLVALLHKNSMRTYCFSCFSFYIWVVTRKTKFCQENKTWKCFRFSHAFIDVFLFLFSILQKHSMEKLNLKLFFSPLKPDEHFPSRKNVYQH